MLHLDSPSPRRPCPARCRQTKPRVSEHSHRKGGLSLMSQKQQHPDSPEQSLQQRVEELEAQLQDRQQQGRLLFSEAPAPYLLLNPQGRIHDINFAGASLLGRNREVLLGKRFGQFLTPKSQGVFDQLLGQASQQGLSHRSEVQLLHLDGTEFEVLLDLNAEKTGGEFQWFRLVITDITAYKAAHTHLLNDVESHQQQAQAHSTRIRELNQELEHVVTVFIQQLHLPLTRVMNFLRLIRRALGDASDDVKQPLLNTERAVQQLIALMATMERYMRVRSMRIRLRTVNLNSVLSEIRKNAQPLLAERQIQITSDVLPTVQGDPQALYLILDEYVANALKFTKEKNPARIHILVREGESEYHIGVEDNGTGFHMRQRNQLFQLFGRLHSSKAYEGTGVGLVTVRRSAQRFGGRVWAEGKVNQGATFWLAWPKSPVLRE
ncbi:ATP-binding protein [Deinococcus oregonensis]|uniref:histidine kinase n=1 Tax=Deinococcus oregonensis TaxID=1805970 RepID=A0ABV6ASL7_9DEIO